MPTLTITRSGNRSRGEGHRAHFRSAPFAPDRSEGCRETPAGSDVPTDPGAKSLQKDGWPAATVAQQEMQTKFGFEGGGSWGRRFRLFGVLAASALVLVACSSYPSPSSSSSRTTAPSATGSTSTTAAAPVASTPTTPPTTAPESPATTTALSGLATLPVKGRAPLTGYSRTQFGPAWTDDVTVADGHNGCDTRNDILRRDLTDIVIKPGTHGCTVASGMLHDPYTNTVITFTRGVTTSAAVQIDHVVALGDAWQTGAQQLSLAVRTNMANDPLELLAVSGPTNEQKGDADAASWLPPNKAFRCSYVAIQVAVKIRYHLWVTQAEQAGHRKGPRHLPNPAAAHWRPPCRCRPYAGPAARWSAADFCSACPRRTSPRHDSTGSAHRPSGSLLHAPRSGGYLEGHTHDV